MARKTSRVIVLEAAMLIFQLLLPCLTQRLDELQIEWNSLQRLKKSEESSVDWPPEINRSKASEITSNCDCNWNEQECGCHCTGHLPKDYLQELSREFEPCRKFYFAVADGRLHSLPQNFFSQIGTVNEFVLEYSSVKTDYFSENIQGTSPFRGVAFKDGASIILSNVTALVGWNWSPLQELKSVYGKGLDISINGSGVKALSSDFSLIAGGSVDAVDVSHSNLQLLGRGTFETFDNITRMLLPYNRITDIRRTILPQTALRLEEIDLRNNYIRHLEADTFSSMPSLKKVILNGNPLREIGQKTFEPIFQTAVIEGLSDLPLICDCKLRWLKKVPRNQNSKSLDRAICRRPLHLRGKPLEYLSAEHMLCR